jgi:hypothetical protein
MRVTRQSLDAAIAICKPGALFRDLGKVMYVSNFLAPPQSLIAYTESQSRKQGAALWLEHIAGTALTISFIAPLMFHTMQKTKQLAL